MPNFIRKQNRLPQELYQKDSWYFVTICVQDRVEIFVEATPTISTFVEASLSRQNHFKLNSIGKIVQKTWLNLPKIFENIFLDQYVIMPNHFHGIIGFNGKPVQINTNKIVNLGSIISRFKNDSRRDVVSLFENNDNGVNFGETGSPLRENEQFSHLKAVFNPHKFWQKSFHDRIIRSDQDLHKTREYIQNNPLKWELDSLNPVNFNNLKKRITNGETGISSTKVTYLDQFNLPLTT